MNIDEAREQLIDLLYGELEEPRRGELLRMVASSPELQEELAALRAARAALAKARAGEPASPPTLRVAGSLPVRVTPASTEGILPSARATRRRTLKLVGWLSPLAAAAAIIAAIFVLFPPGPESGPPTAEAAKAVEIKRTDISITIISEPEQQPVRPLYRQMRQQAAQTDYYGGAQVLYNNVAPIRGWEGLAVVRDQRVIRNLPKGATEVRFTDVPAAIIPESVRLRSIDDPDRLSILEQNYQYDLASAGRILHRYVDKPITIVPLEGKEIAGTLLSFDARTFVIRPTGEGPRNVSREKLQAVRLAELPKGLLTRPTLVWTVDNQAPINQRLEVAYMTGGLSWRADYVLRLTPGVKEGPADPAAATRGGPVRNEANSEAKSLNPKIFDTAEIVGYATVNNFSGVAYENAQLKLMAGDVHLVREELAPERLANFGAAAGAGHGGFEEKSFFEYHLYTLGRPTTLASAETKQIELVSAEGIRMSRGYVYDRDDNPTAARVVSEFRNSRDNGRGLGRPLPKGVIRLYAPDPSGRQAYAAQTTIDHTPRDEKVRLPWGYAFDIACKGEQTASQVRGAWGRQTWRYTVRNHKDYDVTVTVIVRLPRTATQADCTLSGPAGGAGAAAKRHPWRVREVGIVEIDVPVRSSAAAAVDFSFEYDNQRGGGLRSPWDN